MRMGIVKRFCTLMALVLGGACLCLMTGCSIDTSGSGQGSWSDEGSYTASGEEYRANVGDDGTASVEYLGDSLDIEEGEYIEDDVAGDHFCLHMTFTNDYGFMSDSGYGSSNDDLDDSYTQSSLDKSFVIQAVQEGKVIDHRSEAETETIEEDNCWELIDEGGFLDCELYFPVDVSKPVTIQVLNPDGEETVMAELEYRPEEPEE